MHTVRNRLASRPPVAMFAAGGSKVLNHAATLQELGNGPRNSIASAPPGTNEACLIEARPQKRRKAKGKKARKAAARMAATRDAKALPPGPAVLAETPARAKPSGKQQKAKASRSRTVKQPSGRTVQSGPVQPAQLPAIPAARPIMGTYSPPALPLSGRPEPLVEPLAQVQSARSPRVLSFADMPELEALPAEPEVRSDMLPVVPESLANAPLPRARALVPARRLGLIDVIAFLLRDSGRRLARWSARRHRTRAERDALRRAEARQINLQRELDALDALRRRQG